MPLRSVFSTYTENWRFLTWCKICSISRRSAISLFKTGPRCSCRTAKSKHMLLLCEVHKSSSIVQVTTVVLSLQKRSVSLSSLFPANVKYEKNRLKQVFLWHLEIPTKWEVYKSFSRSKLWSAICFKIMTRYTCVFFPRILAIIPATRCTCVFLSRILAFYSQVYDHFLTNAHIYAPKKKPIYMRYKQACGIWGYRKSSYKGHRIFRQQNTPSCTKELKSNFSLNQAWPQWPR